MHNIVVVKMFVYSISQSIWGSNDVHACIVMIIFRWQLPVSWICLYHISKAAISHI